MTDRYDSQDLTSFASQLFQKAGLDEEKASISAAILVEGDLMGHTTHGLALLSPYLAEAEAGRMLGEGQPDVAASTATTQTWDGRYLPGPWLTVKAAEWASAQAKEAGMAAVSIRRSSHIGCLASYLYRVASQGQMLILGCSDPSTASVAPFGGTQRLYTPNPLAAGWPSPGGPVMLDVSMSITTNGMTKRKHVEGSQFSTPVLMDASGAPSADPATFFSNPPGTLLPLGRNRGRP